MARPVRELLEGLGAKPTASDDAESWRLDAKALRLASVFGGELAGEARARPFSDEAFAFEAPDELAQLGVFWVPHLERADQLRAAIKDAHDRLERRLADEAARLEALGFDPGLTPPQACTRAKGTVGGHSVEIAVEPAGTLRMCSVDGVAIPEEHAALGLELAGASAASWQARIGERVKELQTEGLLAAGQGAFDEETVQAPISSSGASSVRSAYGEAAAGALAHDDAHDGGALEVDILASAEGVDGQDGLLPPPAIGRGRSTSGVALGDLSGLSSDERDEIAAALEEVEDLDLDDSDEDEPLLSVPEPAQSEPGQWEPVSTEPALTAKPAAHDQPLSEAASVQNDPQPAAQDDADASSEMEIDYDEPTRVLVELPASLKSGIAFEEDELDARDEVASVDEGPSLADAGDAADEAAGFDELAETRQLVASSSSAAEPEAASAGEGAHDDESREDSEEESQDESAPPAEEPAMRSAEGEPAALLAESSRGGAERSEPDGEPAVDVSVEDMSVEDLSVEDAASEDASIEDAPSEDAPSEDAPSEDAPSEDASASDERVPPAESPDVRVDEGEPRLDITDPRLSGGASFSDLASVVGEGLSSGKTGAIQLNAEAFAYLARDDLAEADALEQEAALLESRARELRSKAEMLRRRHPHVAADGAARRSLKQRLEGQRLEERPLEERPLEEPREVSPPASPLAASPEPDETIEVSELLASDEVVAPSHEEPDARAPRSVPGGEGVDLAGGDDASDASDESDAFASSEPDSSEAAAARDPDDAFSDGIALEDVQALLAEVGDEAPEEATQLHEVDIGDLEAASDMGGVFDDGGKPTENATRVGPFESLPEVASRDVQLAMSDDDFAYTADAATRVGAPMPIAPPPPPASEESIDPALADGFDDGADDLVDDAPARAPGPPQIAIVVDDERARARLRKHLAPRFPALHELTLAEAAEIERAAALDAVVVVRPSLDGSTAAGFEQLGALRRRPPTLVLSSDPAFDEVPGIDLRIKLARRAGEVAQQVLDGLEQLGVR